MRPVGFRGLRRRSVALAAVNLAAAGVGVAAEVAATTAGVWARCGTRERGAAGAVAAAAVARIAAMIGMARAQEVTALAVVASDDADRSGGGGPTHDFAKREARVGHDVLLISGFSNFGSSLIIVSRLSRD
ncbi:unnamed protein product [Urochloa decumbens]|uniref:DUF7358 domain-containing protein n=1 Tax=Urochloa decumbens TaxID=240449 RepID=A0ABC9CAE2_9POAL